MKIQILSDLHLESGPVEIPKVQTDLTILAGDIFSGRTVSRGIDWIQRQFGRHQPIIFVVGNHEFYHSSLEGLFANLHGEFAGTNIHLLENSSLQLGGWTFLGATLWTDFLSNPQAKRNAEALMNDFRLIRYKNRTIRANDMVEMHQASVDWLTGGLATTPERTVVVTHHAPSYLSEAPEHRLSPLNGAFYSNLDGLINRFQPAFWCHGHTHFNVDYMMGKTRVLSNQRGYLHDPSAGFKPGLVIELQV